MTVNLADPRTAISGGEISAQLQQSIPLRFLYGPESAAQCERIADATGSCPQMLPLLWGALFCSTRISDRILHQTMYVSFSSLLFSSLLFSSLLFSSLLFSSLLFSSLLLKLVKRTMLLCCGSHWDGRLPSSLVALCMWIRGLSITVHIKSLWAFEWLRCFKVERYRAS